MELDVVVPQKVIARSVQVHAKVVDTGSYTLLDAQGKTLAEREEDYVPGFFPERGGDYLVLDIELETGKILNWIKPSPKEVVEAFRLGREEE